MAEEKKTSAKKADVKKTEAKSKKKSTKTNPFKSMATFFKSVKAEGKKVVWAKPKEVLKNTIIVLIVVFIAGLAIFAVDSGLSQGMKGIKQLGDKSKETTTITTTAPQPTNDVVDDADTTEADK